MHSKVAKSNPNCCLISLSSMPIKSQSTVDSSGGTCIEDDTPEVKVSSLSCPDCEYIVTDIK